MFLAGVSNSFFGRYASCIALLAISFVLLPLIALLWPALPGAIGRALFYWPQYALLPGGLRAVAGAAPAVASTGSLMIAASAVWLLASAAFVGATRRWPARWAFVLLLPAAALLTTAALGALRMMGWAAVLDGP